MRPVKPQSKPTKETALRVIKLLGYGLSNGLGSPKPGKMCVEAAVCYAMGEPHGDRPTCVSKVVADFKIELNDACWSSSEARGKGLKRIAVAQLGSNTIDEKVFGRALLEISMQNILAPTLQYLVEIGEMPKNEEKKILAYAKSFSVKPSIALFKRFYKNLCETNRISSDVCGLFYASTYRSLANLVELSYFHEIQRALNGNEDKILQLLAHNGTEALKRAKSPGCKWLNLVK